MQKEILTFNSWISCTFVNEPTSSNSRILLKRSDFRFSFSVSSIQILLWSRIPLYCVPSSTNAEISLATLSSPLLARMVNSLSTCASAKIWSNKTVGLSMKGTDLGEGGFGARSKICDSSLPLLPVQPRIRGIVLLFKHHYFVSKRWHFLAFDNCWITFETFTFLRKSLKSIISEMWLFMAKNVPTTGKLPLFQDRGDYPKL